MLLEDYVENCLKREHFPTQKNLVLLKTKGILLPLRNLRGVSELSGEEHGFVLAWHAAARVLQPGPVIKGQGTSVKLGTSQAHKDPLYIGDAHTHPYRLKMGRAAHVGPSGSDFDDVWPRPPVSFKTAFYFVISGSTVFLVVRRAGSLTSFVSPEDGFSDTSRLTDHVLGNPAFADQLDKARRLQGTTAQKCAAELVLWNKYAPRAGEEFAEDNRTINIRLANLNQFEYYIGEMDEGGVASACTLTLVSKPVHSD